MKFRGLLFIFLASFGVSEVAQAKRTYLFTQDGYASGGTVSGFFQGRDANGDGQIYALSRGLSGFLGLDFGNELEYAQVTFSGFGTTPSPVVLTYDKSVADMEAFQNLFMAFAYNVDGGSLGDDLDEGWSLSFFAPSFNYQLGERFKSFWANPLPNPQWGACGVATPPDVCAGLVEYIPDANPTGVIPGYTDFSNAPLALQVKLPIPASVWLLIGGLTLIVVFTRRGQHPASVPASA